jgi:hypothetical protein
MANNSNIKRYYYKSECEICKNKDNPNKNDVIIDLERKLSGIIDKLSNDTKILTFTYNLKKKGIIGNYSRCKNTKRFVDNKQFYFDIYLLWLYYLKNLNLNYDFDFYSSRIKSLSNIIYQINQEKTNSNIKYKKLNCFKAINNLEGIIIYLEKGKYIHITMTDNCSNFKKLGVFDFEKLSEIRIKNDFILKFMKFKNIFLDSDFEMSRKSKVDNSTDNESVSSQVESITNESVISEMENLVISKTEVIDKQIQFIDEQNKTIKTKINEICILKDENNELREKLKILRLENNNTIDKYEANIAFLMDQITKLRNSNYQPLDTSAGIQPSKPLIQSSVSPDHNYPALKTSPIGVESSSWKTFPNRGNLDFSSKSYVPANQSFGANRLSTVPPGFDDKSNNLFQQNVQFQQNQPPLINYQGSPQPQDYNYNGW